ncbi:hypothetical protein [Thalassococcus lentus]|uniref:Uncharacterized protein n=1 Tax=Thalassococcus lentus TaxID=1210524 RepID=A0ABT4XMB7_9RHOB|nr:hypothetical protein [Thalassococcus lentus]MDA7423096.1 hypothetical protein [Thalassococcus lentus]
MKEFLLECASSDADVQKKISLGSPMDYAFFAVAELIQADLYAFKPFQNLVQVHSREIFLDTLWLGGLGYPGSLARKDSDIFDEKLIEDFQIGCFPDDFYQVEGWTNMLGCSSDGPISEAMLAAANQAASSRGYLRVPRFVATRTGKLDLRLFEFCEENYGAGFTRLGNSTRSRQLADELRVLDGSYICIPENVADGARSYFADRGRDIFTDYETHKNQVGRPRKQEDAANAYHQCFPSGHNAKGLSWKEARAQVERAMGQTVDVDTIKRGLGKKK